MANELRTSLRSIPQAQSPATSSDACSTCTSRAQRQQSAAAAAPADSLAALGEKFIQNIRSDMCPRDRAFLAGLRARGNTVTAYRRITFEDVVYDGTQWKVDAFEAGGAEYRGHVRATVSDDPTADATLLYHEVVHTTQPSSMPSNEKEYQAYIATEHYLIDRGLGPFLPGWRNADGTPNVNEIYRTVNGKYPGIETAPATPSAGANTPPPAVTRNIIIGKTDDGQTIVRAPDGTTSTRPPRAGDRFVGPEVHEPDPGAEIPVERLQCPS